MNRLMWWHLFDKGDVAARSYCVGHCPFCHSTDLQFWPYVALIPRSECRQCQAVFMVNMTEHCQQGRPIR